MRRNNVSFNLFVNRHKLEFLRYFLFHSIFWDQWDLVSKQIGSFEELKHKKLQDLWKKEAVTSTKNSWLHTQDLSLSYYFVTAKLCITVQHILHSNREINYSPKQEAFFGKTLKIAELIEKFLSS